MAHQEGRRQTRKTRWTYYNSSAYHHLVGISKNRRKMLTSDIEKATKELIAECCERHDLTILVRDTNQDQVHVFVSGPPRFSPAGIPNLLKGYGSRYLRERFPHLKRICGKEHLGTQSHYVGTAGALSAQTIRHAIMRCRESDSVELGALIPFP